MKEMGIASSSLTYNDIMCLYTNTNQHEKVPEMLAEMKKHNVSPDNYSYMICISSFGVRSDIEGMEKMMKEMEARTDIAMDWNTYVVVANFYAKAALAEKAIDALKKAEARLVKKDGTGFNFLISIYAKLGEKDEVLRLWELEKVACKRCIKIGVERCKWKFLDFHNYLKERGLVRPFTGSEDISVSWSYPPLSDTAEAAKKDTSSACRTRMGFASIENLPHTSVSVQEKFRKSVAIHTLILSSLSYIRNNFPISY